MLTQKLCALRQEAGLAGCRCHVRVYVATVLSDVFVCACTERATDNAGSAGNLALHLEICDNINDSDNG